MVERGEETTQKRANTATNHHHRSARYSGGFLPYPSLSHRRRSPSYNLLVNFASLLEGYVRWDKKYPEWYPPFAAVSIPSPLPPHRRAFLAPVPPQPSCYHHSSPMLCAPAPAPAPVPTPVAAAVAAAAEAPTDPLGYRVRIQGCLHRATGLHHCLRRSANHHHHHHQQ